MPLPSRATFVLDEYRYDVQEDDTVKATYANATELTIPTELAIAVAHTIGVKVFNVVKTFAEAYQVTVEGVYTSSILDGCPPMFTLTDPRYATDTRTFRTTDITVDWMKNQTTFILRG